MFNGDTYKNISVLINYKPGDTYDNKNWFWIKKRYEALMPNAEMCIDSNPNNYSKSLSINNSAKKATGDLFIIADSNIAFNINSLKYAIDLLKEYPFVIPFSELIYISKHDTHKLYTSPPNLSLNENSFVASKEESNPISSIFIVPRIYFEKIGGFNENITEWYEEDIDFINRLSDKVGDYGRVTDCPIWSLFCKKIEYPSFPNGINVGRIHKKNHSLENISWDIRI